MQRISRPLGLFVGAVACPWLLWSCLLGFDTNRPLRSADAGMDVDAGLPCRDVTGDPKNCGACGHDCLGAACAGGLCQPQLVAETDTMGAYGAEIGCLADVEDQLVFSRGPWNAPGALFRVPLDGSAPPTKIRDLEYGCMNILASGRTLFVLHQTNVERFDVDGTGYQSLYPDSPADPKDRVIYRDVQRAGERLYISTRKDLRAVGVDGSLPKVIALANEGDAGTEPLGELQVARGDLWYFVGGDVSTGRLYRRSIDGGQKGVVAYVAGGLRQSALWGDTILWTEATGLFSAPLSGPFPAAGAVVFDGTVQACGLAVADHYAYVSDTGTLPANVRSRVSRVDLEGREPPLLLAHVPYARAVHVVGPWLYAFSLVDADGVGRLPRPIYRVAR